MAAFAAGFDRLGADLKPIRNVLTMLIGTNKPWEVAVGASIAGLMTNPPIAGPTGLAAFLGPKLVQALNLHQ
jgi:hypothetical protein